MSLKSILNAQKKFEKHFVNFDNMSEQYKKKMTISFILSIITECTETLNEIDFKNILWKTKRKNIDIELLQYEIIDIFIFVINIMLIWGINEKDIEKLFYKKLNHNLIKYVKSGVQNANHKR